MSFRQSRALPAPLRSAGSRERSVSNVFVEKRCFINIKILLGILLM